MFQNTSNKVPYVFVPVEYPELAEREDIQHGDRARFFYTCFFFHHGFLYKVNNELKVFHIQLD